MTRRKCRRSSATPAAALRYETKPIPFFREYFFTGSHARGAVAGRYRAVTVSTYAIEFLSFWHEYFRGSQHVIDGKGVKWHVIEIKRLSLILASGTFLRRRVVKHEPPELYRKIQGTCLVPASPG